MIDLGRNILDYYLIGLPLWLPLYIRYRIVYKKRWKDFVCIQTNLFQIKLIYFESEFYSFAEKPEIVEKYSTFLKSFKYYDRHFGYKNFHTTIFFSWLNILLLFGIRQESHHHVIHRKTGKYFDLLSLAVYDPEFVKSIVVQIKNEMNRPYDEQ